MSDSKRQCSKCQFFQIAQLSGNGWCTHPKRQVASDVKILVREKELACRNSWGDDLWVDAASGSSGVDVVAPARRGLFHLNNRVDDEVTSVVDTSARQATGSGSNPPADDSDDVVTLTSVRHHETAPPRTPPQPKPDDLNSPAIADQAERARLMARGSKDAIQKARERHTQRRKPVRPGIAPDQPESSSDLVLKAQDRDQYNPTGQADNRGDHHNVMPVAPGAAAAHGNASLPESRTGERVDNRARLKPEVDLTQLRGFLNRSGASRPDTSSVTSYDLVLERAQEIRAAGDVEREYHRSNLNRRGAPDPAPAGGPALEPAAETRHLPDPASPNVLPRSTVVWDVDNQQLGIAFERARAAIDHPTPAPPLRATPTRRHDHLSITQPGWHGTHQEFDADEPPIDDFDERTGQDLDVSGLSFHDEPEPIDPYDDWDEDEPDYGPSPAESPRGSWWRSLNFGRKRRYQSRPVADAPYVPHLGYDFDPGTSSEYVAMEDDAPIDEEVDGQFDVAFGNDIAPPQAFGDTGALDETHATFATTDESWLQDAWEFPEPQPVEWRESRARLLESSREPTIPDPRSIAATRSRTAPDEQFVSFQSEPLTAIASRPAMARAYSFDEPSGMETLRAALFGQDRQPSDHAGDDREALATYTVDADRSRPNEPRSLRHDRLSDRAPDQTAVEPERFVPDRSDRWSKLGHAPGAFASDFDIRDAIEDEDEEFDRIFDVASRVPKACSTCRSFRPLDNGDRGWCTNDWASTHRQMVNAVDLACRSSIGDWWLAADTSWIPPTDIIQPNTPRTDRLVAQASSREVPAERRGQRVRTSKVS